MKFLSNLIDHRPVLEVSNMLWIDTQHIRNSNILREQLTVFPKYDNLEKIEMFVEKNGRIGIPIALRKYLFNELKDLRTENFCEIEFTKTLRDYQIDVAQKIEDCLKIGNTEFLLQADTGFGKTVMLLYVMSLLKQRTLVIVPAEVLLKQWIEKILEFTSIKKEEIGIAQQNICDFKDKKVVIGMIHSLAKDKYSEEFKNYFGCVVCDEVHRMGANFFSDAFKLFNAKYRIGASARIERRDGFSRVIYANIGSNIIYAQKSENPIPDVFYCNYPKSSGEVFAMSNKIYERAKLISLVSSNLERNIFLSKIITRLEKSKRRVLVLSDRIPQLETLYNLLSNEYNPKDLGIYVHKTELKEKKRILKEAKIILATYQILSTGVDEPTLRALVFASPISDVLQSLGRIRRIYEGLSSPIVFDLVDTYYNQALTMFNARKKIYLQLGCKIKEFKV